MNATGGGAGAASDYPGPAIFLASSRYNLALAAAMLAFSIPAAVLIAMVGMGAGPGAWAALVICLALGVFGARVFLKNLFPARAALTLDANGFEMSRPAKRFAWADCREVEGGAFFVPFVWPLDVPYLTFRTPAPDGESLLEHRIVNIFEPKTADLAATMEAWRRRACGEGAETAPPRA